MPQVYSRPLYPVPPPLAQALFSYVAPLKERHDHALLWGGGVGCLPSPPIRLPRSPLRLCYWELDFKTQPNNFSLTPLLGVNVDLSITKLRLKNNYINFTKTET